MRAEIEAKYRHTLQEWRRYASGFPEPLPFDVPTGAEADVSCTAYFGESVYIDEHRFFAGNPGGTRAKLFMVIIFSGILTVGHLLFTLLRPTGTTGGIPDWILTLIFTGFAISAYLLRVRWPRKANFIFDRDTGMLNIPNGPRGEHVGVDFHRQYFFIGKGMVDAVDFAGLSFFVRGDFGQGEGFSHPVRFYNVNDEEEALEGWHFLVRYMDKEWPFTQEELEFFDHVQARKKRQGYKVEGLRYADGRVEVVGKPMSRIRFPRLKRALAEFDEMGIFIFFAMLGGGMLSFLFGIFLALTRTPFNLVVMGRSAGDWLLSAFIWAPLSAATLIIIWHLYCAARTFIRYEEIVQANERNPTLGTDS